VVFDELKAGSLRRPLVDSWESVVEILKDLRVDWLGKKWFFFLTSWALLLMGVAAYFMRGGLALGIDFTGGTIIYLKFNGPPDIDLIRSSLKPEAVGTTSIQRYDVPAKNTVLVRVQTVLSSEQNVDTAQRQVQALLRQTFDSEHAAGSAADFNNSGLDAVIKYLMDTDPDGWKSQNKTSQEIDVHYRQVGTAMLDYRNRVKEGLVGSLDELKNAEGVSAAAVEDLKKVFYAGPFAVKGVESVGAIVGSDLRRRAALAVGLSFIGMLVYIGFRFRPIYGVAAIVALFHDVSITLGLFALTQKEISLNVIAALLTLVGYSVNDTIVIFDRVRENLRLLRKETLTQVINISINQTMSRTILTSGMTFLAVFSLFLFGGEVLNGFSFALTVGIIIGSYSTVGIAGPIVEWWYKYNLEQPKRKSG
jgi:preprotein translocase subunit SecF